MQRIAKLLANLFADAGRSMEDLMAGFLAHNRLFQAAPDPNGVLKPNQQLTRQLAEQLAQLITVIGSSQARQQASRELTAADQAQALDRLRQNQAALQNDYVVQDASERTRLLTLLFPGGLSAFNQASLKTLPDQLRVFLDLVQDPASKVPQVIIDRTVQDLTPFATTRETQQSQQQATAQARAQRLTLLPTLEEQLTRNLHALCFLFEADRTVVATYFEARYFEPQGSTRPGRYAGTVAATHTNQVLDLVGPPARYQRLRIRVDEERPLLFFRATDPRQPAPATALSVSKATPFTLPLDQLPGTGPLLLAANPGAYVGHYTVELLTEEE